MRWHQHRLLLAGGGRSFFILIIILPTVSPAAGQYMFVDSEHVRDFQEVAKLTSPMTTAPIAGCLSFYYRDRQRGDMFSVLTRDQLGHYEEVWRPEVEATPSWTLVGVDIKAPHPLEVSGPANCARSGWSAALAPPPAGLRRVWLRPAGRGTFLWLNPETLIQIFLKTPPSRAVAAGSVC